MSRPAEHVHRNRAFWDADADAYQEAHGPQLRAEPLAWGVWRVPETDVGALGEVEGRTMLELGCGGAQWSLALTDIGAYAVGFDVSAAQLEHARARDGALPLVQGDAELLPFRANSFDVVFGDHGAMSFCDPARTIPEAARVLKPGGLLSFCIGTPLLYLCYDDEQQRVTKRLHHDYFDMRMFPSEGTTDFQVPYGEWIRLFVAHGLVVEDLMELRSPDGATTTYPDYVSAKWASRWPAEMIWKVRKL